MGAYAIHGRGNFLVFGDAFGNTLFFFSPGYLISTLLPPFSTLLFSRAYYPNDPISIWKLNYPVCFRHKIRVNPYSTIVGLMLSFQKVADGKKKKKRTQPQQFVLYPGTRNLRGTRCGRMNEMHPESSYGRLDRCPNRRARAYIEKL